MPYLNETGLAYYNEKLQPWIASQPVKTLSSTLYPWTLTDKAGAVTCWPVGGTELKPTVDFLFAETPPSNGQPKAPDNPSTITGVSSVAVTRCGKNLIPFPYYEESSIEFRGIQWTVNADGSITANGTAMGGDSAFTLVSAVNNDFVKAGLTYTMSGCPSGGSNSTYCIRFGTSAYVESGNGYTFTGNDNTIKKTIWLKIASGTTVSNLVFRPQLELGSTATTFEPYEGTDYTIPLGNTYYGGSIDVSTGLMTVTHATRQFTGDEGFYWNIFKTTNCTELYNGSTTALYPGRTPGANISGFCSHFNLLTSTAGDVVGFGFYGSGLGGYFFYPGDITVDDWNAFLAEQYANGTPVTVVYPLATPTTVQLTPQQILSLTQTDKYSPRLNTIISDQTSVQVGYVKSPIREEYELQQAIVAQGGNV